MTKHTYVPITVEDVIRFEECIDEFMILGEDNKEKVFHLRCGWARPFSSGEHPWVLQAAATRHVKNGCEE